MLASRTTAPETTRGPVLQVGLEFLKLFGSSSTAATSKTNTNYWYYLLLIIVTYSSTVYMVYC